MALINCPECRRIVSSTAPSCPNCGATPLMRPAPLATYAAQRKVQMAYIASQAKKPGVIYSDRKVGVYQVLALCFGITGAHNFYARRTTQAVIQLGLLLFVWTFVVPFGVFVWNLVEICTVRADGDGKVLI